MPNGLIKEGDPGLDATLALAGAVSVGSLLTVLFATRVFGDDAVGAPFIRTFIGRGLSPALLLAGVATALLLLAQLWKPVQLSWAVTIVVVASAIGMASQAVVSVVAWARYARPLEEAIARADGQLGSVTLQMPRYEPLVLTRTSQGGYRHLTSGSQPNSLQTTLTRIAEDERHAKRVTGPLDLRAVGRAIWRTTQGHLQGASDLSAQTASLLLDLPSGGLWPIALKRKATEILAGFALDDSRPRDDIVRLYLTLVSFGTIRGHEVVGLAEASRAFYGVDQRDLTIAQFIELLARVRNPTTSFPYRRQTETNDGFANRLARHRDRYRAILERAEEHGVITLEERSEAEQQFLLGLRSEAELLAYLVRPATRAIFDEVERRASNLATRHVAVEVGFDTVAQRALEDARDLTLSQLSAVLPERSPFDIAIDATVIDASGAIVAEVGLAAVPGGASSWIKPAVFDLAQELGVMGSMEALLAPGVTAEAALVRSLNDPTMALASRVGLDRFVTHLRSMGFAVTGPYPQAAIGTAVTASVRDAAGWFSAHGYTHLGQRVDASFIRRIEDATTGQVLFRPRHHQVVSEAVARRVRDALERVPAVGTATVMGPLLRDGAIAAKTGTSAFYRNGRWYGNGGSWVVASDSRTGVTVAVRVRRVSGEPFEIPGGRSAALVVRDFMAAYRSASAKSGR